MRVCPACGEENPDRARFCLACAEPLVDAAPAGEERKVVSVLFVDLVGFTGRSDRADPEDVRATLRPYHERLKQEIERFGGTVEKFIGDAVMAVFGAPVTHEDDAERAVRSALRILQAIEELNEEGRDLAVRAAVTTGEAVVSLGARPERGEGIVTGDVVNTAARLQAAAPVGWVIVDELTRRTAEDAIAFEPLEPVTAKGKGEPIPVWRVTGARSRFGVEVEIAPSTTFVGREHELTLLQETFARAERESAVQLVTVVGEPGVGKTRLVAEFASVLDARPDLVSWRQGRCLPYGEGITFWALGEIVKAEAGILESDDREAAAAKLARSVAAAVDDPSESEWFVGRLGSLVGTAESGGAAIGRDEAFTAWRRFLEALAARRPLVLVVEDLHWADGALLEFLEHLLDWAAPVPLLLLCIARPELYEREPAWGGGKRNATTLSLSPLSGEETARLLQTLLERPLLPAETQALLLERAGGNPLYAEQIARMLDERGEGEELAVPETVQALIAARLDTLSTEQKSLLQDASVVGKVFWAGAITAIGGRDRGGVLRSLRELVRREFARPARVSSMEGEEEFSFWHALVRDVAYQQIPRGPRAAKHVAAAEWVEHTAEERVSDHAEILVHHYGQALELAQAADADFAGLQEKLVRFLLLAGDRAFALDMEAAEASYRRAVALSEGDDRVRAAALAKLAPALVERGETAKGIEAYEEAIPELRASDEHAAAVAMRGLARALWHKGETARGSDLALEAISILERSPDPDLVAAYGRRAMTVSIAGRQDEALSWFDKGIALADELGVENRVWLLQARGFLGGYWEGDPGSLDDLREAVELGLRLGLGIETGIGQNNLASASFWFEGARSARELFDEAAAFARSHGLTHHVMWVRGERLFCLYDLGEWEELLREADELVRWEQEHGGGQIEVFGRVHLADVLCHRGSVDEAARHVNALLPLARQIGDPQMLVPGLGVAALVRSAQGDTAGALEHVAELERVTRGTWGWRASSLPSAFRICADSGDIGLAETLFEGAGHPCVRAECARLSARATLAEAQARTDDAAALYAEAAHGWGDYGNVVERAYALLGLGRSAGDRDAQRDGEAIFEVLGARPVAARAA